MLERERLTLRDARPDDLEPIVRISTGHIAHKRAFIAESLVGRFTIVASVNAELAGYLIWDRRFFSRPFIWLLGVAPALRRRGIAASLIRAFEEASPGEPRFTSTNESNRVMQTLLLSCGYVASGSIENIDPGDPELFYFKAGDVARS